MSCASVEPKGMGLPSAYLDFGPVSGHTRATSLSRQPADDTVAPQYPMHPNATPEGRGSGMAGAPSPPKGMNPMNVMPCRAQNGRSVRN
jgi:hypothetical protein